MARLIRDWRVLDTEQRRALGAAAALFVTMLLPWYQQNGFVRTKTAEVRADSHNLTAFGAFSFVEAAVLLVAVAVAYLLYARAEGRRFQVPGSDGAVVFAAGIWTALLLVYRLFDKPSISHGTAANVGVQWGIFFALAAAGLLAYTGSRMRAAAHHERSGHPGAGPRTAPRRGHEDAPRPGAADPGEEPTAVRAGRAEGETAAGRARPRYPPAPASARAQPAPAPARPASAPAPAPARPAPAPAPAEQMSFDDTPAEDA